jgi:alpha-galactosidase
VYGVVGEDGAVFAYAQLASSAADGPVRLRLPGLMPDARYAVAVCPELPPPVHRRAAWQPNLTLTGAALAAHGLAAPMLTPGDGYVLELHRQEQL